MVLEKVDIRPGVSVLGVLRHLNYKPWFALAEFVDNAIQSLQKSRVALINSDGESYSLKVEIEISPDPPKIVIADNAAGIAREDFPRAFRPAALPPDRNGLAEFGMGMKSASCWFAPRWTVVTSAIDENVARQINFDIENIVNDDIQELQITTIPEIEKAHYTKITLEDVFHLPVGKTLSKIKEHLMDIYREFIRRGVLELRINGEPLVYTDPKVLVAPYFKDLHGQVLQWKKDIQFDFGTGLKVRGFAAIRETGNTSRAGFSLFRRGRVIQGSADEGYRPNQIFGASNSFRYQRLFGELHLEGFDVSHTKDGFRWDENEGPFLELLKEHLDSSELPLLKQAEGHRSREPLHKVQEAARKAVGNTTDALENNLPSALSEFDNIKVVDTPAMQPPATEVLAGRQFAVEFRDIRWNITIEISNEPEENDWLTVSDNVELHENPRELNIRVSIAHPFMVRFAQSDPVAVESLLRVAASIALAQILARDAGIRGAGTFCRNINDVLREALSEP